MKCMFMLLLLLARNAWAYHHQRNALSAQTANVACGVAGYLKSISHRVNDRLTALEKELYNLRNDISRLQLSVMRGNANLKGEGCEDSVGRLVSAWGKEHTFLRELESVRNMSVLAAGAAGLAAGRLEEWIFVFAQAAATSRFCIGDEKSVSAKHDSLTECFHGAIGPESLYGIEHSHIKELAKQQRTLNDALSSISFESLGGVKGVATKNGNAGCNLVRTDLNGMLNGGYVGADFTWGGGILNFGKYDDGGMNIAGGEYFNVTEWGRPMWTQNPRNASVFRDVVKLYGDYEGRATTLLNDIRVEVSNVKRCTGKEEGQLSDLQLYEKIVEYIPSAVGLKTKPDKPVSSPAPAEDLHDRLLRLIKLVKSRRKSNPMNSTSSSQLKASEVPKRPKKRTRSSRSAPKAAGDSTVCPRVWALALYCAAGFLRVL